MRNRLVSGTAFAVVAAGLGAFTTGYRTRVQQRYDELVKQRWALPLPALRDVVIGDASRVIF